MRLVTDTNVVVSGLLWGGVPGCLIDAAQDLRIELVTSAALLAELWTVISRQKFEIQLARRGISARDVFERYADLATLVHPANVIAVIERDPADDEVLAAALTGMANIIVSGDAYLLDLQSWRGIRIVRASAALALIAA